MLYSIFSGENFLLYISLSDSEYIAKCMSLCITYMKYCMHYFKYLKKIYIFLLIFFCFYCIFTPLSPLPVPTGQMH
jgi:hypothetical protein